MSLDSISADASPLARRMHRAIGLRDGAVSSLRLTAAARDLADAAGVELATVPALLDASRDLRQELIDRVTVQESSFFRDEPFFAALAEQILPGLRSPLTVWSAGCAHGQEAASVAMLLAESGRTGWRILATDVSERALARAASGRYAQRELRGLTAARAERFLVPDPAGGQRLAPTLHAAMEFAPHNLASADPPAAATVAELVLLRNVLIYFDAAGRREVLARLARALRPGTWILLGGSELVEPAPGLVVTRVGRVYAYRVGTAAIAPVPAAAGTPAPAPPAPPAPPATATAPVPATAGPLTADAVADPEDRAHRLHAAERHAARGDHAAAIRELRRLVYEDPDDLGARLALALSLDADGDGAASAQALRATLATVRRRAAGEGAATFDGYRLEEVVRMVEDRLASIEGDR